MDTNSKSKNKWRWFFGILVAIGVAVASYYGIQYTVLARETKEETNWSMHYENGKKVFVKFENGGWVKYYSTSGELPYTEDSIDMDRELAHFLADYGEELLVAGIAVCMFLLVCFLRSRRIWKNTENVHRKGIAYLAEAAVIALWLLPRFFARYESYFSYYESWNGAYHWITFVKYVAELMYPVVLWEVYFFACFWYLRPLLTLGVVEYLREYSLLGLLCKGAWKLGGYLKKEISRLDFSKKAVRFLGILVVLQFAVLSLFVLLGKVGLILLLLYSVGLFFFCNRLYQKAQKDYGEVRREIEGIANGDLAGKELPEFGMYRPLGEGLSEIKEGFRKAVEEEVKSERMKAELITNVSHDLKTPLTAIMTYVELLKNEDITAEERKSYIETLDNKSKRLKVLIEDLFEVSKAASNNMELQQTDVDLIKLVKQITVEYEDMFDAAKLSLRQTMPEKPCIVYVDGEKTYRIFVNLFSNICKYAMPESRVYVRVYEAFDGYYAEIKNMSAMELSVNAEELTERFVRGDASRNTEGSGLGLAIAKSLTEVQRGRFNVEIDGDLFKVTVGFPKVMYVEETDVAGATDIVEEADVTEGV